MPQQPRAPEGVGAAADPRWFCADNPSPLTLDGTRTYLVGTRRVAILDPGPPLPDHLDALGEALAAAESVTILITHDHPDHADGAAELAERVHAPVRRIRDGTLHAGAAVDTDAGELIALATPGHTADHAAFHWPARGAVFCGDLMLGGQESALVAPPDGDLADYLASLDTLRHLHPRVIYPTHGPPFLDAELALERYIEHRTQRLAQVLDALGDAGAASDAIVDHVYGAALGAGLREAATGAVLAYLRYLERQDRVTHDGAVWRRQERPDGREG